MAAVSPAVLSHVVFNVSNVKDSRWLMVDVCREYTRRKCSRTDNECRFAHPPPQVEVQNGRVTCCFDSIKVRLWCGELYPHSVLYRMSSCQACIFTRFPDAVLYYVSPCQAWFFTRYPDCIVCLVVRPVLYLHGYPDSALCHISSCQACNFTRYPDSVHYHISPWSGRYLYTVPWFCTLSYIHMVRPVSLHSTLILYTIIYPHGQAGIFTQYPDSVHYHISTWSGRYLYTVPWFCTLSYIHMVRSVSLHSTLILYTIIHPHGQVGTLHDTLILYTIIYFHVSLPVSLCRYLYAGSYMPVSLLCTLNL